MLNMSFLFEMTFKATVEIFFRVQKTNACRILESTLF